MSSTPNLQVPRFGNPMATEWMWGYCEPDTPAGFEDYEFTYTTPYIALATSQLLQDQTIPLDSDSAFGLWAFGYATLPPGPNIFPTTQVNTDLAVRFRDGRTRRLMDDFCIIGEIWGPVVPVLWYRPGDTILYDLINNSGANTYSVQLQFRGWKRRRSRL